MAETAVCVTFHAGQWRELPLDEVGSAVAAPEGFVWLELCRPDAELLGRLAEKLALHELAVEDALSAHQRPKLEEYTDSLFLVLRTAHWQDGQIQYGETHLFCGRNFLVIVCHGHDPGHGKALERLKKHPRRVDAGLALYTVLDHVVDEYKPVVEAIKERHQALEAELQDSGFSGDNLGLLYGLKRELLRLDGYLRPLADVCQDLLRQHPNLVTKELRVYYRDVHDHAIRLAASIDRLREALGDAMQFTLANLTLRQSESVQKLAGWGAILAVPTVVFSLYGMNFRDMPELASPWGYPAVLALTAGAGYWLYRRLKQRGWI